MRYARRTDYPNWSSTPFWDGAHLFLNENLNKRTTAAVNQHDVWSGKIHPQGSQKQPPETLKETVQIATGMADQKESRLEAELEGISIVVPGTVDPTLFGGGWFLPSMNNS